MESKILIIQIRENAETRKHELDSIVKSTGLDMADLVSHDLTKQAMTLDELEGIDALIIGGSGEFEAFGEYPNKESLAQVIRAAIGSGMPVLGICFGAQVLADVMGGKCIPDKENEEIGTGVVYTTTAAADDPLFRDCPESFKVNQGHHDRILNLPDGCTILAKTDKCPVQAFRMGDRPVYGVQYHPELDKEGQLWRVNFFAGSYIDSKEEADAVAQGVEETPVAFRLLKDWVDRIVHKKDLT